MHLCRGNRGGHWQDEGSYEEVAERLFNALAIQFYFLEYDTPRAGSFTPLRFVPKHKSVVLGLVSTKRRALCISVLQRDESLPEVATCDELGYKVFDVATVLGLQSSAGVPPAIVAKLQSAVAKVLREPDIAERLKTLGILIAIGVLVMIAVLWWLY